MGTRHPRVGAQLRAGLSSRGRKGRAAHASCHVGALCQPTSAAWHRTLHPLWEVGAVTPTAQEKLRLRDLPKIASNWGSEDTLT